MLPPHFRPAGQFVFYYITKVLQSKENYGGDGDGKRYAVIFME